jgi:hypothetical protein
MSTMIGVAIESAAGGCDAGGVVGSAIAVVLLGRLRVPHVSSTSARALDLGDACE